MINNTSPRPQTRWGKAGGFPHLSIQLSGTRCLAKDLK